MYSKHYFSIFRLYSNYIYFDKTKSKGPDDFHRDVIVAIRQLHQCFETYSVRTCIYLPVSDQVSACVQNVNTQYWLLSNLMCLTHYENLPMQYTDNFLALKIEIYIGKFLLILICLLKTLIVGTR